MRSEKRGYVYILEVKDIVLPVCKIGRTERTPYARCDEINNSSTGDFIWEVAHYVAVDDCRGLEALVHKKLGPLRQKRREFFNIGADDAYTALRSILEKQREIHTLDPGEMPEIPKMSAQEQKAPKKRPGFACRKPEDIEAIHAFTSVLNIKGRPFGATGNPDFGISDGESIQWNLMISKETGATSLGVNLEGSEKTGKWLIVPFILSRPDIENLKGRVSDPASVFVRITRDAWQAAARLNIVEKYLGGGQFTLPELNQPLWERILRESLSCLDEEKDYRGRAQQEVTLVSNGKVVTKGVSPHLNISTRVSRTGDIDKNLREAFRKLRPAYEWVHEACGVSEPPHNAV